MNKLEKLPKEKIKRIVPLIVAILCAILLFTTMISSYLNKFENALIEENSNYLSEIGGHIALNMQTVVADIKKALETAGYAISALDTEKEKMQYLQLIEQKYGFEYVGYASTDGFLSATLASEEKDISNEVYFQRALSGEKVSTFIPRKIFSDKAISAMLISIPIYDLNFSVSEPTGTLVAMLDLSTLSNVMRVTSFGGQGHTYVIDVKGEIVMHTKRMDYSNLYMALENTQFAHDYKIDKMIADVSSKKPGFAVYSEFGVEKYMYYRHLGIDSWTLVNVIEKDVITTKTTKLIQELTFIGIVVMILFPLLLIFTVLSYNISNGHRQVAEAKTAFLANMSHEIRTPMNAIVGISEILLRENITGKQKNYVLSIVNAGNGLLTIINDILDISKMESGKFVIVDEEYELESLIYDLTTIVAIKIGDKPIDFLVDLDPGLPKFIYGDMIRVKQILLNIIGNAVKFTEKGTIRLGIYARFREGKLKLIMPVEDTGIGIQKKDIDKLFVSFNQVDTHKNHNVEGTGLGLVISKRLSEMMGGTIDVDSTYGKGSTFTVSLELTASNPAKMLHITKPEQFRILLLEPSSVLRNFFANCMNRMKLEHDVCSNYASFLENLRMGGYTHVIAGAQIVQRIIAEKENKPNVRFAVLLSLKEQSLMDDYERTIIAPLFTMQLVAVLYNRQDRISLIKRSGMDVLAIAPMPFVKILLVDDNEVNIQVANGLMIPYHMQVDCAFSGKQAIEMISEESYDLIFMDHMMPEMDGMEAVKIIRNLPDPQQRSVTIVALTANVTYDAKEVFLAANFDDFLAKPIETIKLNAVLKKWLKSKNDARAQANPQEAKQWQKKIAQEEQKSMIKTIREDLSNTTYVNFALGIEKLGNHKVYANILSTYYRTTKEKIQELPELLESDMKAFAVEIHGLKGASAGISAELIAKIAAQLEELAKQNRLEQIREALPEFLQELEETLEQISLFIEKYGTKIPSGKPKQFLIETHTDIIAQNTLNNIREAFLDFDTENLSQLLEAQKVFSYDECTTVLLEKLQVCYCSYDFDTPIILLDKFAKSKLEGGNQTNEISGG